MTSTAREWPRYHGLLDLWPCRVALTVRCDRESIEFTAVEWADEGITRPRLAPVQPGLNFWMQS
jgi:hypothetical protein